MRIQEPCESGAGEGMEVSRDDFEAKGSPTAGNDVATRVEAVAMSPSQRLEKWIEDDERALVVGRIGELREMVGSVTPFEAFAMAIFECKSSGYSAAQVAASARNLFKKLPRATRKIPGL